MSEPAPPSAAAAATEAESSNGYDRWILREPSSISYGYYAGSVSNSNRNELVSSITAAANVSKSNDVDIVDDKKKKKGFYITTAINYTNGPAHMGHAYEAASADAIARFARLNYKGGTDDDDGVDCYFVTGADEHGEKIAKTAEKEGKAPIEICDKVRLSGFLFIYMLWCTSMMMMCTHHSLSTFC